MLISEEAALYNTILSFLITLIIALYRKNGAMYRRYISWLAYLLVITYGSIPIRYITGSYHETSWLIVFTNLIILIVLLIVRGNISRIINLNFNHRV